MKNTVFVVGAGASKEFNLPIGSELKKTISQALNFSSNTAYFNHGNGDGYLYDALQFYTSRSTPQKDLQAFMDAAKHIASAMPLAISIDNFINSNSGKIEVELCAKLAIAHLILKSESSSLLRSTSPAIRPKLDDVEQSWLGALIKLLFENCTLDDLPDRLLRIKFIVFNYDRCIEHFLYNAIQIYYNASFDVAARIVNSINIYHPYGVVGKLPWQRNTEARQLAQFGDSRSASEIMKIAMEIKTFTEGMDPHHSDIIAIRHSLDQAQNIVFLGFAYHPLNIDLLVGDRLSIDDTRNVYGTAFGMSDNDTEIITGDLSSKFNSPNIEIRNDILCAELFHQYSRALSFVM